MRGGYEGVPGAAEGVKALLVRADPQDIRLLGRYIPNLSMQALRAYSSAMTIE